MKMYPLLLLVFLIQQNIAPIRAQTSSDTPTESYICSSSYCAEWQDKNTCPELPERCQIQNSTHNGVFMPYNGPCNCCKYCVANLREGEECSVGHIGLVLPDSICGPGLSCVQDGTTQKETCQKTVTNCTQKQDEYDKKRADGTLGDLEVRPICDSDGKFGSYKCLPGQSCFCLDEDNNRIFGEIDYTNAPEYSLKCPCSRNYQKIKRIFEQDLTPGEYFRCTENGDYDTLQCIDDKCFCTDSSDGASTYPGQELVNITLISNETLPCFDKKLHNSSGHYHHKCALEVLQVLEHIEEITEKYDIDTVFNLKYPNCSLDGRYAPVQENLTHYYCADPDSGKQLEDYAVDKTNPNAKEIDCKCARTRLITSGNLNECCACCPNGNFNTLQCRRGLCRCVDSDGYQIEQEIPESEKDKLSCYENQCY